MIDHRQIFNRIINTTVFILVFCLGFTNSVKAQFDQVHAFFKNYGLNFDLPAIGQANYTELSIWKQKAQGGEYDESGQVWSNTAYQYQYATCSFEDKKVAKITLYDETGKILKRFDFYYLDNLLSAIDEMIIDEKAKDVLICTHIFFYEKSGLPFQKVRTFAKEANFREITAFSYNAEKKLIQSKVSYVGHPKHALTLANLGEGLQLISFEYLGEKTIINTFKNYNTLIKSEQYNGKEELNVYGLNNIIEKKSIIAYDGDLITKVKSQVFNLQVEPTELAVATDPVTPLELQYFYYNEDKLLQTHITELFNEQVVFNYNYYKEEIIIPTE